MIPSDRPGLRGVQAALLLLAMAHGVRTPAQDEKVEATPKTGEPREGWLPVLQQHAKGYVILADGPGGKTAAAMRPDPLMRWTQPIRGGDDGILCLWVDGGHPVVAMTIFTFKGNDGRRNIVHEHQSLSALPLEGTWNGRPMWQTTGPGITFAPVPDAPPPADTPASRLRQMQAIARDVSANTIDNNGSTWPLRALVKPLYRYEVADGGLFALVQGNDPEAFLLLESRVDGNTKLWYYGVARLTDLRLRVRLKGREVYSVPYTTGGERATYQTKIAISKASDAPEDFLEP